jgi:hypothetical protein
MGVPKMAPDSGAGNPVRDLPHRYGFLVTGDFMKKTLFFACVLTAVAPATSLFITDDTGGTIWKVFYRGTAR